MQRWKKYYFAFIILTPDVVSFGQGAGKYNIPVFMWSNIQNIKPQDFAYLCCVCGFSASILCFAFSFFYFVFLYYIYIYIYKKSLKNTK